MSDILAVPYILISGILFLILFVIWSKNTLLNGLVKVTFFFMTAWALWLFMKLTIPGL